MSADPEHREIAFPEAIVGLQTPPRLPIPVVELQAVRRITPMTEEALYVFFHWPWSKPGDPDSHTLYSLN